MASLVFCAEMHLLGGLPEIRHVVCGVSALRDCRGCLILLLAFPQEVAAETGRQLSGEPLLPPLHHPLSKRRYVDAVHVNLLKAAERVGVAVSVASNAMFHAYSRTRARRTISHSSFPSTSGSSTAATIHNPSIPSTTLLLTLVATDAPAVMVRMVYASCSTPLAVLLTDIVALAVFTADQPPSLLGARCSAGWGTGAGLALIPLAGACTNADFRFRES